MRSSSAADDDAIPPRPWWVKVARIIFVVVAIASLFYLNGIYQYFFLHRTPLGAEQPTLTSKIAAEQIVVPVSVHVLSGNAGSAREDADINHLIDNANRIWTQANIMFVVRDLAYHDTTIEDLRAFDREPHTYIINSDSYDPAVANLYLTRTLSGVNGLAYGGTSAIAVADFTSTLDYRTLAHEFGHLLGLSHTTNTQRLMSSGATGTELTPEEITTARAMAREYSLPVKE